MNWSKHKKDDILRSLQDNFLKCKQEMKHYKYMYQNQCRQHELFQKQIGSLQKEVCKLQLDCQQLRQKLKNWNDYDEERFSVKRKQKEWSKIKCDHTKHQRISHYGEFVLSTIKDNMPQCIQAEMCLCLGEQRVNYSWQCKDLNSSENELKNGLTNGDHSYAAKQPMNDHDDDLLDVDYSKIFDTQGNWQTRHKRSLITVLDAFRISHEAYHELRQAGKSHFSPLHHIIKEKGIMSDIIPYVKHPTVSNRNISMSIQ